jgi:hypothetical protein
VNHVSRIVRFTVLVAVVACLSAVFAASAFAYTGYWVSCNTCHTTAPTPITPAVTAGAVTGTNQAYTVSAPGATEWAVFAGYSRLASGTGSSAAFSVPVGTTYSFYAIAGSPTAGAYGTAAISPAYIWVEDPTDVTPPVSTSDAVASYVGYASIRIDATDDLSGVERIYYKVGVAGSTRTTPTGVGGYAIAYIRPTTAGTFNYTLYFWAEDREGNIEAENSVTFSVTREGTESVAQSTPLTTLGPNGMSQWTYQDLADSAPKYEGGYAAYGGVSGYYADPHGGYDTTTNKCKVCHAVHRAEGAYYLLRADSQDDACDYCHIGGSAHSSKVVYVNGKGTSSGHTIGASTYIPDSSVAQWTEEIVLSTVDANGNPLSEIVSVRAYDEAKNDMYRFARHHGHSEATGGARRNYVPVGPLALRCMSCHQVHNADAMTWQTQAVVDNHGTQDPANVSAYKLLKQFPSGTFVGTTDDYGQIALANISLVPETTLTAGVNYDAVRAMGAEPTALNLLRGTTPRAYNKPMWVASDHAFWGEHGDPNGGEPDLEQSSAAAVNQLALSVWCADCHNLNIGGWDHLDAPELGFKSHTERTHPAPYTAAHSGPGQCYSCHRSDLSPIATGDNCSQCHYGTGNYYQDRIVENVASDFPHSGDSYKLLGNYSVDIPAGGLVYGQSATTIKTGVTIGPNNLDAVCLRCHGGIGTYH